MQQLGALARPGPLQQPTPGRQANAVQRPNRRTLQRPTQRPIDSKPSNAAQDTVPLLSLSSLHPELQQLVQRRQHQHQHIQKQQQAPFVSHPLCHLNPAALTTQIKQCSSWRDAAVLFAQQAPCMNHINLSALLTKLAHLPGPISSRPANWQTFVRQVLVTSQPLMHMAEPRHLANMAWALAKLGLQDWVDSSIMPGTQTASSSSSSQQQMPHQRFSSPPHRTSGSGGDVGIDNSAGVSSWGSVWQQQVLASLHNASCRDVSNILWALATNADAHRPADPAAASQQEQGTAQYLQQEHQRQHHQQQQRRQWRQQQTAAMQSRLIQELLSALHRTLPTSSSQDVANALWALATLQARPSSELQSYLLIRVQAHFAVLKPCEVATTLWALAQLQAVPPSSWLQELMLRQVGRQQWQDTQPRHWIMCLTACAQLKHVPPAAWLTECLHHLQHHMMPAAAAQQQEPGTHVPAVDDSSDSTYPVVSNSSGISSSSSSTGRSRHSSSSSSSRGSRGSSGRAAVAGSQQPLSSQDLSNTIWALATLRVKPNAAWMSAFLSCSTASLAGAAAQELVNTMWGLQVLRVVPSDAWLAAFDASSMACMSACTPQGLADILAAQVRLGLRPSWAWCEAWATAVKASWGSADASAVCKTLWAAAKCQVPLGRSWLGAALQQVHEPLLLPALASGTLRVEELLRLMWAVGRLCRGNLSQDLSNLLGLYCCRAAGKMTGVQLARGAWGLARLVPLPREGLLSYFHDLAVSKVKYLPQQEGGELLQKLALLQDAVAKDQVFGSNWRQVLQQRQQQLHSCTLEHHLLQNAEEQQHVQQVEQPITLDQPEDQVQHVDSSIARARVLTAVRDALL